MKEDIKVDKYDPTTAENKLLDVMLNPENRTLNVTDTCAMAKITRAAYYKIFNKPDFVEYYRAMSKKLVSQSLGPVINACVNKAKEGSYHHIKIILEMGEVHLDKVGVVDKDGENITFNVNFVKPKEDAD